MAVQNTMFANTPLFNEDFNDAWGNIDVHVEIYEHVMHSENPVQMLTWIAEHEETVWWITNNESPFDDF